MKSSRPPARLASIVLVVVVVVAGLYWRVLGDLSPAGANCWVRWESTATEELWAVALGEQGIRLCGSEGQPLPTKWGNMSLAVQEEKRRAKSGMTVAFTNANDEPRILEWAVHHITIGFDQVVIYDDMSNVEIRKLIPERLRSKIISLRACIPHALPKTEYQTKMMKAAKTVGAAWATHLDADEFIVFNEKSEDMKSLMKKVPPDGAIIYFHWLQHGSAYLEDHIPGKLMHEMYTHHTPVADKHIKSVMRINDELDYQFENPHHPQIGKGRLWSKGKEWRAYGTHMEPFVGETKQTWSLSWMEPLVPLIPAPPSLQACPAFVSHLETQARSVCVRRKILKLRDDIFELRVKLKPTDSLAKWDATCNHKKYNEVQSDILSKYAPQVRAIINHES